MHKLTGTALVTAAVAAVTSSGGQVVATAEPADATEVDVVLLEDMETVVGSATLRRLDTGVYVTLSAGGHEPGHIHTLWVVVFNAPENCSDPCNEDDVFIDGDPTKGPNLDSIANVDNYSSYGGGTITNDEGEVFFAARLDQGQPGYNLGGRDGAVLKDASTAVIHLITRSHGPAIAGIEDIQLTTGRGGCEGDGGMLPPPAVSTDEGLCYDRALAVFAP